MIIDLTNIGPQIYIKDFDVFDQPYYLRGELWTGTAHEKSSYLFVLNFLNGLFHSTLEKPSFMSFSYNSNNEPILEYVKWHNHGKLIKMYNVSDNHLDYIDEIEWLKFVLRTFDEKT